MNTIGKFYGKIIYHEQFKFEMRKSLIIFGG
jgi:hypothetical protein